MAISPTSYTKQPSEIDNINIDFTKLLSTSEEIQTKTIVIKDSGGIDVTNTMLSGSSINSDKKSITLGLKAGTDNNTYTLTIKVTTNVNTPEGLACLYEEELSIIIKET